MTTSSRRDFLSIAAAGSALAASGVLSTGALAAPADLPQGGGGGRYVPPVKFGLGGVPFGNEFEVVSDEDVAAALIVGAHTEAQVLANVSSMEATIPLEFWAELKRQNLIEQNAPTPTAA
jgi:D-threo-aldose 1-dehydrogenase